VVFLDEPTAALDPEAAFIVREAIETLQRGGRTIVLATHNLDEADRLCDRIAFVRAGLVRVDTPAALRGTMGTTGLTVRLGAPASADQLAAVGRVAGVVATDTVVGVLRVSGDDPESLAPAVVRALVASGADVVELRPERATLERVYFDVMGVRPGADGIEDAP
jgi:ABC-2 type transport system ATP-binding protein